MDLRRQNRAEPLPESKIPKGHLVRDIHYESLDNTSRMHGKLLVCYNMVTVSFELDPAKS